jgi:hypothetical protein
MSFDRESFLEERLLPAQGGIEVAIYISARLSGLTQEQAVDLRQEFELDGAVRWGTWHDPKRRDVYASIDTAIGRVMNEST